jgi:putative MATE family efflux protein
LFAGIPGLLIYNFGAAILRSVGDNKSPFVFLGISTVLNFVLNFVFVIILKMGISGIAIATVVSQYVPAILVWICLLRTHQAYYFSFKEVRLVGKSASAVLKIGVPTGLQAALFSVANLVMQVQFNKLGTDYIAANSACSGIENLIYTALTAMSQAVLVFAGQNVGAGLIDRLKKLFFVGGAMSMSVGLAAGLFVVIFRIPLLNIFTDDAAVVPLAESRLVLVSLTVFVHGLYESSLSVVRGMGYSLAPMVAAIFGICVFRIIWVYCIFPFFPTYLMLVAIWPISQLVTGIAESMLFLYYFKKIKQKAAVV